VTRGTLFEKHERTVIGHWSFVIGEKNSTLKPILIGRGCQPPAPWTPAKTFDYFQKKVDIFIKVHYIINAV
jgi:hypothetical protein